MVEAEQREVVAVVAPAPGPAAVRRLAAPPMAVGAMPRVVALAAAVPALPALGRVHRVLVGPRRARVRAVPALAATTPPAPRAAPPVRAAGLPVGAELLQHEDSGRDDRDGEGGDLFDNMPV